jgi:Glutamine cyclotransferase
MSNGSDRLHFLDPTTFAPVGSPLTVHDGDQAVDQLNELEWADGRIYANVWHDSRIAVIDPRDGAVRGWLDLSSLVRRQPQLSRPGSREDVLNGIAWDARSGHFFVTGKDWPHLYEIAVAGVGPAVPTPAGP